MIRLTPKELTRAWNVGRKSEDGTTAPERIALVQLKKVMKLLERKVEYIDDCQNHHIVLNSKCWQALLKEIDD